SVVGDIEHRGGRAVANTNDCGDWDGAAALVECALEHFGRLDVLVNNAGILRRAMSYDMTEADWDAVVRVHLKGHFAMSHFAARGITGQLFLTYGGRVALLKGWHTVAELPGDGPWSAEGLVARGAELFRDQGSTPEPLPFATPRASTPS